MVSTSPVSEQNLEIPSCCIGPPCLNVSFASMPSTTRRFIWCIFTISLWRLDSISPRVGLTLCLDPVYDITVRIPGSVWAVTWRYAVINTTALQRGASVMLQQIDWGDHWWCESPEMSDGVLNPLTYSTIEEVGYAVGFWLSTWWVLYDINSDPLLNFWWKRLSLNLQIVRSPQ